ncbi:chaperonin 10-like protein [Aspergillus tetrazonus]
MVVRELEYPRQPWRAGGLGILEISRDSRSDLLPQLAGFAVFFFFASTSLSSYPSTPATVNFLHRLLCLTPSTAYSHNGTCSSDFRDANDSPSKSLLRNVKNLAPLLDRVLVQRVKPEAKTASGIFLPESSVKEQNEAKVLAVGPGAVDRNGQRIPMGVAAGDRVLVPQFGGSPLKIGDEEYHLFRDSEILAKINE